MLLRGVVPRDEVQVVVDGGVAERRRVADDGVEVAFGRGDEVDVVEEDRAGEGVPALVAILHEGTGEDCPSGA